MTALPKRKISTQRGGKRERAWQDQFRRPGLIVCSYCGKKIPPHKACPYCGYYKNALVLKIKEKSQKAS
ncbi:MAG: 50S ribosomal protein L32 [Patescibacteria group bacterium]|jgi:large subunit ribosomal protein L32